MQGQRIVLATSNAGKLREFAALLAPLHLQVVSQQQLGISSAEETGTSFEENALLKARHASGVSSLPALADDSGLEVDGLQGEPGVYSARYAGPNASDAANLEKLLCELARRPDVARTARYRCVVAFVRSAEDAAPILAQGQWEGQITLSPKGTGGFGYDPAFIPAGFDCTVAEMSTAHKNQLSHRALALQALLAQLK